MRIIQITDLHINRVGETSNGIDTPLNFLSVLNEAVNYSPDLIAITGDICHISGNKEVYVWVKSRMDILGIPYYVIAGNHDESAMISEVFGYEIIDSEVYYSIDFLDQKILFLDSRQGSMSEVQYTWIKENVNDASIVFMHYPPVIVGVPHMDTTYSYKELDKIQEALGKTKVFCGHVHNEIYIEKDGLQVFTTPSCFLQIGDKTQAFYEYHRQPAFRIIDISEEGMNTRVKYLF